MQERDFALITRKFPEREDIRIYPISDLHIGALEHNEDKFIQFRNRILEDNNGYVILNGDLINNATKSSVSNIFDETMRPREQKRKAAELLEPLRDRILCCVSGNHERRSGKDADDDPTYDILCKLDLEHMYRENMAFVRVQMGKQDGNGLKNPTYIFAVTHGAGGGMLTGGAVNRGERFGYAIDGVDALIIGHTHKPFVTHPGKIFVDARNDTVSVKPFWVVCSTAWMDYGGYAMQKMLNPSSISPQIIHLAGNQKRITIEML